MLIRRLNQNLPTRGCVDDLEGNSSSFWFWKAFPRLKSFKFKKDDVCDEEDVDGGDLSIVFDHFVGVSSTSYALAAASAALA